MIRETTKNTLLEAKNAALRAELDEARRQLSARDETDRNIGLLERQLADSRRKLQHAEKLNAQLAANQPTAEQYQKLQSYEKISRTLDARTRELSTSRNAYETLNGQLYEISAKLEGSNSAFKGLRKEISDLEANALKTKRWFSGTAAFLLLVICALGAALYLANQDENIPAPSLSAKSREAYNKLPAEQQQIINQAVAAERSVLSQPNPFGNSRDEGFVERFIVPFGTHLLAFTAGFFFLVICWLLNIFARIR